MATTGGNAVIGEDLVIEGEVRNGGEVEVRGAIVGALTATRVVVHPGGRVVGRLDVEFAEIKGFLDGVIRVRQLISIGDGGVVQGDVRYGQLALAPGGDLAAEVRNVPPELSGDFEVVVRRGRRVRLTTADIDASDADNRPEELVYRVSDIANGFLVLADDPSVAVNTFTDAHVEAGAVWFVHDASEGDTAGFDVTLSDPHGATAGPPRRVTVVVMPA